MASVIYSKINGAFSFDLAPFAVHQYDLERARIYLDAAVEHKLSRKEALADVEEYLTEKGASREFINQQLELATEFFRVRLD
jgi:hypothetical protein